jgi:light-regulated signal transduction histidine kinase (bacteriophytochrome)
MASTEKMTQPKSLSEEHKGLIVGLTAKLDQLNRQLGQERVQYLSREQVLAHEIKEAQQQINSIVELVKSQYFEGDGWVLDVQSGEWVQRCPS